MIEAVVFDMDGVLLDSERLYRIHWIKAATIYGISEDTMQTVCNRIAGGSSEHTRAVFAEVFGAKFPYEEMRQKVFELMDEYISVHGIDLKPGIVELLQFLKQNGVRIALATSTERERATTNLKNAGIFDYFDECVFGNQVKRSKPDPDIYLTACSAVGVDPKQAMGVEDSINGIFSVINAGMTAVFVEDLISPTEEVRKRADRIYSCADEIMKHWDEFNLK